jgi:hypothetical protein
VAWFRGAESGSYVVTPRRRLPNFVGCENKKGRALSLGISDNSAWQLRKQLLTSRDMHGIIVTVDDSQFFVMSLIIDVTESECEQ